YAVAELKALCEDQQSDALKGIGSGMQLCLAIRDRIEQTLHPEPPVSIAKGNVIAEHIDEELDRLRKVAFGGKDYLLEIQRRESEATGIPSLKIAFNNVFGYYLEVTHTHRDKVPESWVRKQTLVNA